MTPREKAIELVDKFVDFVNCWDNNGEANYTQAYEYAKQCALITCNEVLGYMGADRGYEFWTKVKQEIEKL